MAWFYPESMNKDVNPKELDDKTLIYYHDNLHVFWSKLKEGVPLEWSFGEVYKKHKQMVEEMHERKIKHIVPINNLDNIKDEKKSEERILEKELAESFTYSIEEKMNGFHVGVHKKGNEIKIFSEQKKDLTKAFPTLTEEIKKLSDSDFIIDGELVPYDKEGNTLGRNVLMKYVGAVKSGETPDDSNIRVHIWDILYYGKDVSNLALRERIEILQKLKFSKRISEINRKKASSEEELKKAINWVSAIKGSEGAVVKDLDSPYFFGENKSWKKYRKLTSLIVKIIKKVPKERGLYNYLVGIPATKKYLNPEHIANDLLVLGHTFNTKQIFNAGDKIKILIEEIWRHETKKGIHYSIHKPRVDKKTDETLTTIDKLEEIVTSIGVAVTHAFIEGQPVLISEQLAEKDLERKGEGKEIEVKNFPERMQSNFKKIIGKWMPYTIQWHLRGEKSIHSDIRFKIGNYLEGITLFTPPSIDKPDLLTPNAKNVRGTIKVPQPFVWLKIQGRIERGAPGSTKEFPSYFATVAKGMYTVHEVTDHKLVFEFRSDKGKVRKMIPAKGEEYVKRFNSKLPGELKPLRGKYSFHIAHISDRYIILFDKVKD